MVTTTCKRECSATSLEKSVPKDHPLRPIRKVVDEILRECPLGLRSFIQVWNVKSMALGRLFRALLLQIFSSVRSERMLIEQLQLSLAVSAVCGDGDG